MLLGTTTFYLRSILSTITNNNPFCPKNVLRFRIIGYAILAFSALDFLFNIQDFTGTMLLAFIPYFTIKLSTLIFLLLGLLALTLAEIFNLGFKIKKENELTI
ncbi:DUF2975 domain-containing protein [Natranaerofaba carboxydovora]|uniref:DUF2975 domain-containing protein n=1 Tax=Natranaerofaba carboxydovora TaxID=2742683 RepID=UPI003B8482FA